VTFAASAEPVYLNCLVKSDRGEEKRFSVTLDDASGKITHSSPTGSAFNTEGFFSANTITYQNDAGAGSTLIMLFKYQIDRTNLSATEELLLQPRDPEMARKLRSKSTIMAGKCEIEEVKDRKI